MTGNAVGKFKELLEKRVFLLGVISDFLPSFGLGEYRAERDDDNVNEFMVFTWVVSTRVFESTEMLDDVSDHSGRLLPT